MACRVGHDRPGHTRLGAGRLQPGVLAGLGADRSVLRRRRLRPVLEPAHADGSVGRGDRPAPPARAALPAASTLALLLCLALPLASAPVHAQTRRRPQNRQTMPEDEDSAEEPATAANDPANAPAMIFGAVDTAGFRQAVNRAMKIRCSARPARSPAGSRSSRPRKKKEDKQLQRDTNSKGERKARKDGIAWLAAWPSGACGACWASCCWCCC